MFSSKIVCDIFFCDAKFWKKKQTELENGNAEVDMPNGNGHVREVPKAIYEKYQNQVADLT